ncbi:beta-glucanase [Christiangramia fulva]|uniref:Beta-glucanase n=1 Tax=Christiangramia fulva TaxID=2126553 RepID=A0A2R3Z5R5_9FLAO|nr:glycoside hydrolase family 16 protein [Christiangramia fulva]AVR45588.1 beta-glucanase [Christiangramia fulva]
MKIKVLIITIVTINSFTGCKRPASIFAEKQNDTYPAYNLVWADEFNENGKPHKDNWSYEHGFLRNNELQWYQEENASLKNGSLIIEGRREKIKNPLYNPKSNDWRQTREFAEYTSSSLNTRGKKEFKYGIIEVRAKIDTASGNWPAIWTLGIEKPWPANGEVDIMEFYKIDGKPHILANAAWNESQQVKWDSEKIPFSHFLEKDSNWSENFHIWKMDWTREYIRLYLDDDLLNEIDLNETTNPDGFNPFRQPHYLLLNLALGSNGGDPVKTRFPVQYKVDYVRVYQKK